MSKLLMLRGLPASGKSTYAKELTESGWIRVNKDLMRTMLHFDKFDFKREDLTKKSQTAIVETMLLLGKNVVVDDTNLGESHKAKWSNLAHTLGVTFETKTFNTSLEECIERDKNRDKRVGEHVIKNMALQYDLLKPRKKWVLCDIDGTIADTSARQHYVQGEVKDWKSFFAEMINDHVRISTLLLLENFRRDGYEIIFVSARPENYRDVTVKWLNALRLPYTTLMMRRENDKREDSVVKKEILDTYFNKEDIYCVIDDRPRVIKMWRENGLQVIDVGNGIDF